jgi:hypothetical protein
MKIFISHSSKNADYGNALVDLLIGIGIQGTDIIFTSNDAHGIPVGQNIFNWLKARINEKPYVIYLLSPDYYKSVACLNEMGAAWIVENDHAMIFTPNFDLTSYEFRNGALDPREIGFFINNENRLISFIEQLKEPFNIQSNAVLINQRIRYFLKAITPISEQQIVSNEVFEEKTPKKEKAVDVISKQKIAPLTTTKKKIYVPSNGESRFYTDFRNGKLKEEELLLAKYIIDTDRFKLGTGWQASDEIQNIRTWEDINEMNDKLSSSYNGLLKRFEMKKLTEVSDHTSFGNPKEVCLVEDFRNELLDPSGEITEALEEVVSKNLKVVYNQEEGDDLPF